MDKKQRRKENRKVISAPKASLNGRSVIFGMIGSLVIIFLIILGTYYINFDTGVYKGHYDILEMSYSDEINYDSEPTGDRITITALGDVNMSRNQFGQYIGHMKRNYIEVKPDLYQTELGPLPDHPDIVFFLQADKIYLRPDGEYLIMTFENAEGKEGHILLRKRT